MSARNPDSPLGGLRARIPGLALGAAAVFAALATAAQAEPDIRPAEWAAKYRYVAAESQSPQPGWWKNETAPYLVEVMDACEIGNGIRRVVITGGNQFGKTDAILNSIFHACDTSPRPYLVLLPSLTEADAWSSLKWDPNITKMLEETPRLARVFYRHKSRSNEGSTNNIKRFRGGRVEFATAAASKGLQLRSVACVVADEVDQFDTGEEGRVGVGGDPIVAAENRMNAFGDDRKTILASTPGFEGSSRIWSEWLLSDMRKWFTPCPHCDDFHVLDFETFGLTEGRPSFSCPSCGGVIEQSHRREMNARGLWLPTFEHAEPTEADTSPEAEAARAARLRNPAPPKIVPRADIERWRNRDCEGRPRGYHLWQAQSNLSSWAVIWDAWDALQKGVATPGADIEFSQKILGLPFARKVDRPNHEKLWEARGVMYPSVKIGVPEWAGLVTGAIDVQHNRLEWAVYAWGRGGVGARIAFGVIPKNPLTWSTWSEDADRLVRMQFEGPNYRARVADYWLVDSGGNATNEVYAFCYGRNRSDAPVLAIKGDSHDKGDAPAIRRGSMVNVWRDKRIVAKVQLWIVGPHGLKSRVYEGLQLGALSAETKRFEARSLHFPREMSKEEFGQLTAEHLKRPKSGGKGRWEKVSAGAANEQLDLAVYCLAGAINAMMDNMNGDAWTALLSARAPDKVKATLTPLELLALPDDDPVKIAAAAPKAEAPKAEGSAPPKPTAADMREVAKLWGG